METQEKKSRFEFNDEHTGGAKICVVGVGGGGGNAVNNMISHGWEAVDFMAINTDEQDLKKSLAGRKVQAGLNLTRGEGAGARPQVGIQAVMECSEQLQNELKGFDLVILTAGMGGGTGTGGVSVVADIAKRQGSLVVAIVTKPFAFEGVMRMDCAMEGIERLKDYVDTMIVIPNERLLDIADEDTTMIEAFQMADKVLENATRGISDLVTKTGRINLDFADLRTTIQGSRTAFMGVASGKLESGVANIALDAISNPLMEGLSINGARNVLVNMTAVSIPIMAINEAMQVINTESGGKAEVISGVVIDESMGEEILITVIATGFTQGDEDRQDVLEGPVPEEQAIAYKGSENLRVLDTPAWERRKKKESADEQKIRYINGDRSVPRIKESSESETTPAFLRKMMD